MMIDVKFAVTIHLAEDYDTDYGYFVKLPTDVDDLLRRVPELKTAILTPEGEITRNHFKPDDEHFTIFCYLFSEIETIERANKLVTAINNLTRDQYLGLLFQVITLNENPLEAIENIRFTCFKGSSIEFAKYLIDKLDFTHMCIPDTTLKYLPKIINYSKLTDYLKSEFGPIYETSDGVFYIDKLVREAFPDLNNPNH